MNNRQFLLTKEEPSSKVKKTKIGDYNLYLGEDLEYESVIAENIEFHLLGSIYDWEKPKSSNSEILSRISKNTEILDIIRATDRYSGEFIVIAKLQANIYIFNDASAQREVYYDTSFNSFGSQPNVIGEVTPLEEHSDKPAYDFYHSNNFLRQKLFIGETTHKKNVKHLMSNHLIDVNRCEVSRFYPFKPLPELPLDEVASKVALMLKGYIQAICLRYKSVMAVTGGFDSRVIFLASLDTDCKYFVTQSPSMKDNHPDIMLPKKITSMYEKEFHVVTELKSENTELNKSYIESIDFPRNLKVGTFSASFSGYTIINGNVSEVARNVYGYSKNLNSKDLAYLLGYKDNHFAITQYEDWLLNKSLFEQNNYHYLDMLYWEQRVGMSVAKVKSELEALGCNITTPYNSRDMVTLMLSNKREYRDYNLSQLHKRIIYYLTQGNKEVMKIPFFTGLNPLKTKIIMFMARIKVYQIYRYIGLKTRLLRM